MEIIELIPRIVKYNLFREFGITRPLPTNITVTVTDICNFMCKTCNIGRMYLEHPEIAKGELTADEYDRIFGNIGKVFWVTLTGGEPFFRKDLTDIVHAVVSNSSPKFMTIPTNGYVPKKIADDVERLLGMAGKTKFIVNISLDGIGQAHDEIRGMKNSFDRVIESYFALRNMNEDRLTIGINTVISKFNVKEISDITEFVEKELKPDSFITEVAENRSNLYNENDDIKPDDYEKALKKLSSTYKPKNTATAIIKISRGVFYKSLMSQQSHRCFSGFASACIMPKGDVWLSCARASSVGNLRDMNYDFKSLWSSEKANSIRKELKKPCKCMLANAHYTNLMCNPFKLLLNG